jgi:hypothetical protein
MLGIYILYIKFTHVLAGWEKPMQDRRVWKDAFTKGLCVRG